MYAKPAFHGSDLEKISEYYQIPKDSIINFGANVNPLGLSHTVRRQLASHLDIITTYPDREYSSLRSVIGSYCGISADHVIVGNGSTELISLLIKQRAPKRALVLGPTYSEYARELSFVGGTLSYYYLDAACDFKLDISDLCRTLTEEVDLFILCNPNNPTSSAIGLSDMEEIVAHCRQRDIFVMIDETYVEFVPDIQAVSAMPLISRFDNLMILRGVSKFFAAPGLRLGYGATDNPSFLARLKECQNPWSLNSIAAYAGELILTDHDYIAATRSLILSERTRILKELDTLDGCKAFNAQANFILVQLTKEGLSSAQAFDTCIRKGLMIRDCASFESLPGEFVRFCIMSPDANTALLGALRDIFL